MISTYYGRRYSIQTLREHSYITRQGVSMMGIVEAAEEIGLTAKGKRLSFKLLEQEASLPCIVYWQHHHFAVVYRIASSGVYVADPALGKVRYTKQDFITGWTGAAGDADGAEGFCLLLKTTPSFYEKPGERISVRPFRFLLDYLRPHRMKWIQLSALMVAGSLMLLVLPFLAQAVVDRGIGERDVGFIYLLLLGQITLILGKTGIDFLRGWILLHISTLINVKLIADFLAKLMKLPVKYFETRLSGDILQQVGDHTRVEYFLSQTSLSILFAFFNFIVFTIVLAIYSLPILFIFLVGSSLYFLWIALFMRRRRELDQRRFQHMTENQNAILQMVSGMQEIKLNRCEAHQRRGWEEIQARLFRVRQRSQKLLQHQTLGSVLLNESKNLLITVVAALAVVHGDMKLGVMFAVQFIIGQMAGPLDQMIGFLNSVQDARISLERLASVHDQHEESEVSPGSMPLPAELGFSVRDLVYQYAGPRSERVLDGVSIDIPAGRVTAIVGASGSGKSTLIKLLLGFYQPVSGTIELGGVSLQDISQDAYREICGAVMQDGYLFSDTLAANVALSADRIDPERLAEACRIANAREFIEQLPLKQDARVGHEGQGLSQGQRQRILIARAVYKNPGILFFDEATNALDAGNERAIMENLSHFYKGRTVVVVAHRLSTVVDADQIIVLERGRVVERGTHQELIRNREGIYYRLIRNQLELGG